MQGIVRAKAKGTYSGKGRPVSIGPLEMRKMKAGFRFD
jgi:hypothetical protein